MAAISGQPMKGPVYPEKPKPNYIISTEDFKKLIHSASSNRVNWKYIN